MSGLLVRLLRTCPNLSSTRTTRNINVTRKVVVLGVQNMVAHIERLEEEEFTFSDLLESG